MPPDTVARAYRGEPIPGIPKEATELGLKNHVIKVHQSAAAMLRGDSPLNNPTHLYVLNSVPPEIIADVTKGSKLPHLSDEQMKVVKVSGRAGKLFFGRYIFLNLKSVYFKIKREIIKHLKRNAYIFSHLSFSFTNSTEISP